MKINELKNIPTVFDVRMRGNKVFPNSNGRHESLLRSFHLLEKVKEQLRLETPSSVILEIIDEVEQAEMVEPYIVELKDASINIREVA